VDLPVTTRSDHPARDSGRPNHGRSDTQKFLALATNYWRGPNATTAWVLTFAVAVCIALGVYVQARINIWNGQFFTAVERKAEAEFAGLLWQFAGFTIAAGAIQGLTVLVRMAVQIRLRQSISRQLIQQWMDRNRFYRLHKLTGGAETPEFRIADDVRLATDPLVDLSIGFVTSLLLGITFLVVLANVGGSLTIKSLGITVPSYFLIGALLYAVLMSGLASSLGWPLIKRIAAKNHREGVFRYELMRVRENATAVAKTGSQEKEQQVVVGALGNLVQSWASVIVAQAKVASIASSNAVLVGLVPVILAVPKYVSGEIDFGTVMQLATAFIQVQVALNWIVDNFVRFAEMRASANRVGEFVTSLDGLDDRRQRSRAAALS
jgi:vitamin B12/bleomycin/antimicrobial peptide transport system ATP-binding/permease protein